MSQYSTGTASVTNNSPTVTGSGTLWASNVSAGDSFTVAGDGVMYDVASVDSDTQITLSVAYAGVTASGVVYAIGTGFTVPDSFPEMSQGDIETATIFTRAMRKIQGRFNSNASDISGKADISGQVFTGDIKAPKITASTGILFGTDTAAANTLDGYEEGIWEPEIAFGGSSVGIAYVYSRVSGFGSYTKVGRQVTVNGFIGLSAKGSSTGTAAITKLPFAVGDTVGGTGYDASGNVSIWSNLGSNHVLITLGAVNGSDTLLIRGTKTSASLTESLTETDFTNDTAIRFSCTYFT